MSNRAIDYFLVIGPVTPFHAIDPPHPTSTPRSYIDRTYASHVTFRYPPTDHTHLPLPPGLPMFALPDDLRLSTTAHMPAFFYFVVTGGRGERLYGSCLRLWEEVGGEEVGRLVEEERRLERVREAEEVERKERGDSARRKEMSVSLSKEEEREAELEEELEREQAKRLISMHNKIQEEQAKWREHKQQKQQQQQQPQSASPANDKPAADQHRLTIQLQPSPHHTSASASSPDSSSNSSSSRPHVTHSTSMSPHTQSPSYSASSPPSAAHLHPFSTTFASPTGTVRQRKVYAPRCLVTLSLHPFLSQCRSFLTELYRLSLVPSVVPLEHYIANFINEIPLPPFGELKVQYSISNKLIYFFRPPANNPLLFTHYPLRLLFECLDSDNALRLIEAVLTEQRVLLLSTKLSALTVVAETLLHLIFPLRWPHVYIPLLPRSLIDFLYAPMPFIIGMHHAWVKGQLTGEMAADMVIVDLDANRVTQFNGAAASKRVRQLPAKERKKLKRGLTMLRLYKDKSQRSEYEKRMMDSMDDAFTYAPSPDEIEQLMADQEREEAELARHIEAELRDEHKQNTSNHRKHHSSAVSLSTLPSPYNAELFISSLFFRAFTSLLKDYRPFLILPTAANPSPDPCFHAKSFLRHHDSGAQGFLAELLATQAFTNFCEERMHPSPHTQSDVVFFDESIVAKRNRSRLNRNQPTPFLADERYALKETYVVPVADVTGCKGEYRYERWPELDYKLFPLPRKMPALLTRRPLLLNGIGATGSDASTGGAGGGEGRSRRYSFVSTATLEQTLYSVWFVLVTCIASEYEIVHLLSSCFHVLYDARLCGVRLEQDVFVRVMKAAAGLSLPDKAVEALSIMQDTGYPLDGGVYGQLLAIFSEKGGEGMEALKRLRGEGDKRREGIAAAYSPAASPQGSVSRGDESDLRDVDDEDGDSEVDENDVEVSLTSSTHSNNSVLSPTHPDNSNSQQLPSPSNGADNDKDIDRKANPQTTSPRTTTDTDDPTNNDDPPSDDDTTANDSTTEPHNPISSPSPDDLTRFHRNFAAAFPHLSIDTADRCPECGRELSDREIRQGWTERNTDYTTCCPKCGERFAAQFVISNNPKAASPLAPLDPPPMPSSPSADHAGSNEAQQFAWQQYRQASQYRALSTVHTPSSSERFPLTVPYLPPRVLHKELTRVIEQHGVGYIVHGGFRLHSTALYWNTVWHLLCVALPVQFMLWEVNSGDPQQVKQARSEAREMVHVGRHLSDEQAALRKEKAKLAQRQQRKRRGKQRRPHTPQQHLGQPQLQQQISESSVSSSGQQQQQQSPSSSPLSPQLDAVSPFASAGSRLPTVQETHSTADSVEQHALP